MRASSPPMRGIMMPLGTFALLTALGLEFVRLLLLGGLACCYVFRGCRDGYLYDGHGKELSIVYITSGERHVHILVVDKNEL
ncbi:hypothetical protein EDB87DRAFT_386778 [Lactarius vividus]|nr:hypothetical protein EDB87DRAFT_386778 [Lactarius vividus]